MKRFVLDPKNPNVDRVRENAKAAIDATPNDRAYIWERKPHVKKRTDKQNAALWAVAYPPLADHTGYSMPELHELFCKAFFGVRTIEFNGQTIEKPRRTTTTDEDGKRAVVSTKVMNEFYARVQQGGSEVGVNIPDPDPMHGRFPDGR